MSGSFRLGTIAGGTIFVHLSWLIFGVLLSWSLAAVWFPAFAPGWPPFVTWGVALVAVLLVFASVLVHEAAHALIARTQGLSVNSLTLFPFGSISNIEQRPARPGIELLLAFIGPATSLLLAGLLSLLWLALRQASSLLAALCSSLAIANALLAVVNLLPAFPLDGGRVLRSVIWIVTGSALVATRIATLVGQGMAYLLILVGVGGLLLGDLFAGIWVTFLGWFVLEGARFVDTTLLLETALEGRYVEEIMNTHPVTIPATLSLQKAVNDCFLPHGCRGAFVIQANQLVGLLTLRDLCQTHQEQWEATTVRQVMIPLPQIHAVAPHQSVHEVLSLLVTREVNQVPVVKGSQLVGVVSWEDLLRFVEVRRMLGVEMEREAS